MANLFGLHGRVVCVTGGYGHLGYPVTAGLREAGATAVVLARSRAKFDRTVEPHRGIHFVACDVASSDSVIAACAEVSSRFGGIDALINNAVFLGSPATPSETTDEVWARSMEGVVGTVHRCIRAVLPYFREANGGRIVNVASMYGMVAPEFSIYESNPELTSLPAYGAGKAAIIQLTKYFASLLASEQILVNCVSPGPFPSPDVRGSAHFAKQLADKVPLGRVGSPEELVGVFVFLCSQASSYMTGQNLVVDGGWTIT